MKQKLKEWSSKKFTPGITMLAPYLIIAGISFIFWECVDTDSYYMMAQGKSILEHGIPEFNTHTFHENFRIVVQQYPYCVLEYLASLVPRNIGLWAMMLSQAMLLFHLVRKWIEKHTPDKWVSTLAAMLICTTTNIGYFYSLRPENLTLILLLLECEAIERYRDRNEKKWLIALPVLAFLEANLHGSMWPFHLCVFAAYAVPAVWPKNGIAKNPIADDHVKWRPEFLAAGASMVPAMLLNPYGLGMLLYPIKSMRVFKFVPIMEQKNTTFMTQYGMMNVAMIIVLALLIYTKRAKSTTVWMSLGFLFLSCVNYHCSMFIPIAQCFLIGDALAAYEDRKPARTSDLIPNGIKLLVWSATGLCMLYAAYSLAFTVQDRAGQPALEPAASYIAENQGEGENVFNNLDIGSMLLYYGVTGIHSDSRPELMLKSINGQWDAWAEYSWFRNGLVAPLEIERYGSVQGYMDANNIQFIVDTFQNPAFPYLQGWLADNPDWVKAELHDPEGTGVFSVWIRADRKK